MKLPFRREHTGTPAGERIQRTGQDLSRQLRLCPFIEGRMISVHFAAGVTVVVNHGLGAPAACIVARQNYDSGTASVRLAENVNATDLDPNNQTALIADAVGTFDLWFYKRASQAIPDGGSQSP